MRGIIAATRLFWQSGGKLTVKGGGHLKNRFLCVSPRTYCSLPEGVSRSRMMDVKVNPLVAVCQMTATSNKDDNFATCKKLIEKAKVRGAQMVFLPECFDFVSETKPQARELAEGLTGSLITSYRDLARSNSLWLSLGGFHEKGPADEPNRLRNTHILINSNGDLAATYSKTHLFDLDIKGIIQLRETDFTIPGPTVTPPVETPVGKIGMSVCYDLRFPELSLALTQQGAEILTYPSAFTVPTGMAHWHTLLKTRAIENQCYVIAAAQVGRHNEKRVSYGHSVIIDPWGSVVAECKNGTDISCAEIDLDYLYKIREEMPVQKHRRHDLYGHIEIRSKSAIDDVPSYTFGQFTIRSTQVFYKTPLSIAFVNIKPVLPGHVLVSPIRVVEKFGDLTPAEVADLFTCVQKVTKVVEEIHGVSSSTVAIQDGPEAGQSVNHVHVHILPRKAGDFKVNDDVYTKLQDHDKNLEEDLKQRRLRTEDEMEEESHSLRKHFS